MSLAELTVGLLTRHAIAIPALDLHFRKVVLNVELHTFVDFLVSLELTESLLVGRGNLLLHS